MVPIIHKTLNLNLKLCFFFFLEAESGYFKFYYKSEDGKIQKYPLQFKEMFALLNSMEFSTKSLARKYTLFVQGNVIFEH